MQLVWTENADPFCDDDHSQPKKEATRVPVALVDSALGNRVPCLQDAAHNPTTGSQSASLIEVKMRPGGRISCLAHENSFLSRKSKM
jgi:hypothetical protein